MLPLAELVAGADHVAALSISPLLNLGPSSLTIKPQTEPSLTILVYFLPSLIPIFLSKLATVSA